MSLKRIKTIDTITNSTLLIIVFVFGLGLRHGLDLDHIATIDSITRTLRANNQLSKRVGFLFSLGHGLVVIILSVIISNGIIRAQFPTWLEPLGSYISIFFLLVFGLITLHNCLVHKTKSHPPISIGGFFALTLKRYNAFWIILTGALFAFSFDTFSQVALFSISMSSSSNWYFAALLGLFFMLGMMATDGLNGFMVSLLIQRADKFSFLISRLLGFFIASFSLILGLLSLYTELNKLS
ncbi:DNA repair protein [Legionella donaldsonii]|uniref:HoxN/HupN/NixA family nickel/cobalt transporter n=1 Tax=Legionella donaldsonii TaxID=45060 RepID=UPI001FE764DE|nr:DNA repair protein [Legionella donaldsonii]